MRRYCRRRGDCGAHGGRAAILMPAARRQAGDRAESGTASDKSRQSSRRLSLWVSEVGLSVTLVSEVGLSVTLVSEVGLSVTLVSEVGLSVTLVSEVGLSTRRRVHLGRGDEERLDGLQLGGWIAGMSK